MPKDYGKVLALVAKLRAQVLVNVGRNYNGPKVAKFLVGEVPTCTNRATRWALSQPGAQ